MTKVLHHKVVVALPLPLEPDSIYYVRAGSGFDIHVTNGAGVVTAYSLNADLELDGKVDKELGYSLLPNTEITRLATMATGATKNRADSENADKLHAHTTAQVEGLDAALGNKVGITDPRLTDSREWSEATVPQAEAETGTASTRRAWTAQRVRQAINAWWQLVTSGFGRNFIAATNEQAARNVLQLGTAATKNVGDSVGDVLPVGVSRLGQNPNPQTAFNLNTDGMQHGLGLYYVGGNVGCIGTSFMSGSPAFVGTEYSYNDRKAYVLFGNNSAASGSRLVAKYELYHTGNTTKNPDGTLKASSPVINLYTDHHDTHNESQFGGTPVVTRKSKGVYEITGTLGLRSEGWYLDTPNDRNGNKYFNVEWTQNITPAAVDGIVDEYRDDIVVKIETFERVWNKETGIFENGAPIDINELQDRFVQLRFNEIKVEHEEHDAHE